MADIIGHPWMQGDIPTEDQIREEFKARALTVHQRTAHRADEKQKAKAQKKGGPAKIGGQTYLSASVDDENTESGI